MREGMEAWLQDAVTRRFWLELCPDAALEGPPAAPIIHVDDEARATLWNQLLTEGYFQLPPALPPDRVARMADAVLRLSARAIPPVFAYVYDDFWHLSAYIAELLGALLDPGFRMLPDFWAWHVEPRRAAKGWHPHRDRGFESLRPNGQPRSLSIWVPLTDATTENGCMYVLPACRDPYYLARDKRSEVVDVQEVRALPAAAGSVLGWNQALLHWGSRASERAATPRISFSIEYQRGDEPPFNRPLLDPLAPPPFERRLGLVGKQILQYRHMMDLGDELARLAGLLKERFLP